MSSGGYRPSNLLVCGGCCDPESRQLQRRRRLKREALLDALTQKVPAPGSILRKDQAMRRMEIRVCDPQQVIKIDKLYNTKNYGGITLEHYADTQNGKREAFTRIMIRYDGI
jgi:hypothetical protein